MQIKQIRNATLKVTYAGKTFLIDPWLIGKGKFGSFADVPGFPFHTPDPVKEQIPMPIFELPEPVEKILDGVDYYLITHIHPDHIDMDFASGKVGAPLNKKVTTFAQDETDAAAIKNSGFVDVKILSENSFTVDGITLTKTPARHGTIKPMCDACGVIFQAENEKTLYIVGDTVWIEGVEKTLKKFNPDVVVMNCCAAEFVDNGRLIMNDEDVESVAKTVPAAKLVITHMDNVAHASITRHSMRGLLAKRGVKNYFMPEDGEVLQF